jgi:hypothetical protein
VKEAKLSPYARLVEIVVGYVGGRNQRERHRNWGFGWRYQQEEWKGACAVLGWQVFAVQGAREQEWIVGR